MSKFNVNKTVRIYFAVSWLIGILIFCLFIFKILDDLFNVLMACTAINIVVNSFAILLLFVFYYIFPENRKQFKNSVIVLLFNFPNLCLYCMLIFLISNCV